MSMGSIDLGRVGIWTGILDQVPSMLQLSAEAAAGAHPYFVPPEHTAIARQTMGPDAALYPEQMVVLDTDAAAARSLARKNMALYLRLPNYTNNLLRLGFEQSDIDGGPGGGPSAPFLLS